MAQERLGPGPRTALITGASRGIGCELARLFAQDGYGLALVARSRPELESVARELASQHGVPVAVVPQDLAQPGSPEALCAELRRRSLDIDVLVNNAGMGTYGFFAELDLETELRMAQLNMVTLTHLTRLLLQPMLERGAGRILNVSSTAAFQPGPLMAVYYASKAYVLSFSEAIANELRGTGVTVTCLCPGPTRTGFQARAKMERSGTARGKLMDAAEVARIGYRGMMAGKALVIPGLGNQLLAWAVRFGPRGLVTNAVRRIQEAGGEG